MLRPLLSLVLMTAQLLSWNLSPLHLCVGTDGSVCVDSGPISCVCCRHRHHEAHECGLGHDACCGEHDEEAPDDSSVGLVAGGPCDCTHIQILYRQSPAVISACWTANADPTVAWFDTVGCGVVSLEGYPAFDETTTPLQPPDSQSLLLTLLASVVLRC